MRINLEKRLEETRDWQNKYYDETASIVGLLEKKGFRPLFLKGVALAQTLYEHYPEVRPFGDIDILVPEDQANNIFRILLKEAGYHCPWNTNFQKLLVHIIQHYPVISKKGLRIDIHHRLTLRFQPYSVNTLRIIKDARRVSLNGTEILIPCLEDMLLHLCIHLYFHHAIENSYKLNPHADIHNMISNYQDIINWNKFVTNVLKDRLNLPVAYSLYYTNIIYGKVVPKQVLQNIMSPEFEKEKDAMKNVFLLSDVVFGFWHISYLKRLFSSKELLLKHMKECFLSYVMQETWANAFREIGIQKTWSELPLYDWINGWGQGLDKLQR